MQLTYVYFCVKTQDKNKIKKTAKVFFLLYNNCVQNLMKVCIYATTEDKF